MHGVCVGRPIPFLNPVTVFTAAVVLSVNRPSTVVPLSRLMATTGSVPAERVISGPAPRHCPLCGCEALPAFGVDVGAASCSNCGFDLSQLGEVLQKQAATESKPAAPAMDSLDRWLSGEAIQPKWLSDRDRAIHWIREHRGVCSQVAAVLVVALRGPIVSPAPC